MTDCPNAEMRDRLPDLLHESLDAGTRTVVLAHIESCADCRAEFALIREAHVSLVAGVRSVDVIAISRAVVERTRTTEALPSRRPARRSAWSSLLDWRVAASIAVLLVGGGSVLLMRGRHVDPRPEANLRAPAVAVSHAGASTNVAERTRHESTTAATPARPELSAGGEVSDLSESDLRALLHDLNSMDAVPATEPEPVVVRVSLPGNGGSE